jgi:hypothetical protein
VITIDVGKGGGMRGTDRGATQNGQGKDRQRGPHRNDFFGNACPVRRSHASPLKSKKSGKSNTRLDCDKMHGMKMAGNDKGGAIGD